MRAAARALDARALARWPLPDPGADADKEGRGHVLVVAGSEEVPGAALLAAVAALRAGAGKLTIAAPRSVAMGLALAVPEARVIPLDQGSSGAVHARAVAKLAPLSSRVDAVVVGPGMLDERRSLAFLRALMPLFTRSTVVLDAVAMSVVQDGAFSQPVVLTPHAGEMAHLLGQTKEAVCADTHRTASHAAQRWKACVALKGASTCIAMPDGEIWHFSGGSVGLATSGSGDTLAGVIGGLAARGLPPVAACSWGVVLHARAGAALARRVGPLGYLARELAGELPALLRQASAPGRRAGRRSTTAG
ncbi:MAG: NAD(P)H-hydrate dehydratase [Comamonadaceae bacterium]|nr:MAG: NAD(P)H-hydrate dehydratase [Comamonadaceae bacterium]